MTEALTLLAPAKLNLTLEVLGRRDDGYHEIESVVQTVSLYDRLSFRLSESTSFFSSSPGWQPEMSLVPKAVALLREATSCARGVTIEIEKNIPLGAGLGGDSSDAACVLIGLNQLWGLRLSRDSLHALAARLGSDIPLFLYGGTVLISGRGEKVKPLPALPHLWFVILKPDIATLPDKTARLYAGLPTTYYSISAQIETRTKALVRLLKTGMTEATGLSFHNSFQRFAFDYFPELNVYSQKFLAAGAKEIHLTGTGPAMFTITRSKNEAERIYQNLKKENLECYLAEPTQPIEI
ncbi:MAG: 4-(cytidine 5'-diphospho)-2-C-methyl-D-erythritol kinase [Chloroflexota bacterium]